MIENEDVKNWIVQKCQHRNELTPFKELYKSWEGWAVAPRAWPMSKIELSRQLSLLGYRRVRTRFGINFCGLAIKRVILR